MLACLSRLVEAGLLWVPVQATLPLEAARAGAAATWTCAWQAGPDGRLSHRPDRCGRVAEHAHPAALIEAVDDYVGDLAFFWALVAIGR